MIVELRRRVLAEHLARRSMSQNAFAMKAGISSGYIVQLIQGTRNPSPRVRERLLKATGMDFDGLFKITGWEEELNA